MMPEYIVKGKAKEAVDFAIELSKSEYDMMCDAINRIPAADVATVVHGRWTTPKAIIECSKCGFGMFQDGYFFEFGECVHANESQYRPNFCPNCGAKMDLEGDK